jgi:hypothetical protein
LSASLERIGVLQSQPREAHLEAHLDQARLLTCEQTARYMGLRGYDHPHSHPAHEHH